MEYSSGADVCCKPSKLIRFFLVCFFTCCSISIALLAPNFSSLSGDGKLRKEATSGGRVDGGVDTYRRNREKIIP